MTEADKDIPFLADQLSQSTSLADFYQLVAASLQDEDLRVLGENAAERIQHSMVCMSIFGSEPLTWEFDMFHKVACVREDDVIPPESEAQYLLAVGLRLGLIQQQEDRYTIDSSIYPHLERLLDVAGW